MDAKQNSSRTRSDDVASLTVRRNTDSGGLSTGPKVAMVHLEWSQLIDSVVLDPVFLLIVSAI